MSLGTLYKDPSATHDYCISWASWLAEDETISTVTWTVPAGITNESSSETTTTATIWLSGGRLGHTYRIACLIETSANRIDERTFLITIQNQ